MGLVKVISYLSSYMKFQEKLSSARGNGKFGDLITSTPLSRHGYGRDPLLNSFILLLVLPADERDDISLE